MLSVADFRENQPARRSLERAGNLHADRAADQRARVVDDDHRPIGQVANGLVRVAAFLDEAQFQFVADT